MRKACADVFPDMSLACNLGTRHDKLTPSYLKLLHDESRWVRATEGERGRRREKREIEGEKRGKMRGEEKERESEGGEGRRGRERRSRSAMREEGREGGKED